MFVCVCVCVFQVVLWVTQTECCRRRRCCWFKAKAAAAAAITTTATDTHKKVKATTERNTNVKKTIIAKQIQVQVFFGSRTIFFSYFIQFASDCLLVEVISSPTRQRLKLRIKIETR